MDPFTPHLPAGNFRPEAYVPPDLPPRAATASPDPGSAREVDRDRRPTQPAYGETTIELGFADFLDVINPLQHIPVVGDIYRALTDDQIAAPARVAGGAIFGGPLGFISGIFNAIVADAAGQNLGEVIVAAIFGDGKAGPDLAQTAGLAAGSTAGPAMMPAEAKQVIAAAEPFPGAGQPRQPLTGAAALQALGADLRTAERRLGATPAPAPTQPRPTDAFTSAAIDARHLAPPPRAEFTNRLIEGLNQYKALVTETNAPSISPGTSVDTIL